MSILNQIGHVENPSARIQFLQVPQTAPGQCGICGNGRNEEGFADTGLDFEFWGRLILCNTCAGQIAAVFGWISPFDYDELLGEKDLAQLNLQLANDEILEMRKVIDGLTNLRSYFSTVSTGTLNPDVLDSEQESGAEGPELSESSSPDESNAIEQRKTTKPPGKQGLLNI